MTSHHLLLSLHFCSIWFCNFFQIFSFFSSQFTLFYSSQFFTFYNFHLFLAFHNASTWQSCHLIYPPLHSFSPLLQTSYCAFSSFVLIKFLHLLCACHHFLLLFFSSSPFLFFLPILSSLLPLLSSSYPFFFLSYPTPHAPYLPMIRIAPHTSLSSSLPYLILSFSTP